MIHPIRFRRLVDFACHSRPFTRFIGSMVLALLGTGIIATAQSSVQPAATAPSAVPAFRQADHIAILRVDGPIDRVTLWSLERRMKQAKATGATAVVIELNTPGGDMATTLDICNLLKDRNDTPANVVAWIHPTAYSAGTYMALACREIVVSPNARFGDAAPIQAAPGLGIIPMPQDERAKMESPLLAEVIDSARRNHYDELLVQSFVSVGVEIWLIEHKRTGERIFVDREEYKSLFGEEPQQHITSITPPVHLQITPRQTGLILPSRPSDVTFTEADKAKVIADFQTLPSYRTLPSPDEASEWRLVAQIDSNDRLLVVNAAEAMHFGLAQATIASDDELKAFFGATRASRFDENWSESLVRVLTNFWVRVVLIIIFLVCLFVELAAPGFGVFGVTSLVAFLILVGAPMLVGMAQWWDVLLIVVGMGLIAAELFIIPGFGVAGIAGAVCLLVGMVGTFVSGDISSVQGQEEIAGGLLATLIGVLGGGIGIWIASRYVRTFPIFQHLVLSAELRSSTTTRRPRSPNLIAAMRPAKGATGLLKGAEGVAHTDLRPAGRGMFEGRIVDVQSDGSYIAKGARIRVVNVGGYVIDVEEVGV